MQSTSLQDACHNLDDNKIIECINKGLDKSLGPSASQIVLKTLEITYGINKEDIPASLDVFESLITKVLGDFAAKMVLESIANECKISNTQ